MLYIHNEIDLSHRQATKERRAEYAGEGGCARSRIGVCHTHRITHLLEMVHTQNVREDEDEMRCGRGESVEERVGKLV